ncbi:MAG: hypothetical protein JJE10_03780, partial [Thermoleophilia bacterium]|nr:hypothetical protein [Thermoleophilia bacterium]
MSRPGRNGSGAAQNGEGSGAGDDTGPDFFGPCGPLTGMLTPPADKSISHRAAIIGAIADGPTSVSNFLDSDDTRSTLS